MRAIEPPVDIAVVRWPAEADARALLARDGRPRLLLVGQGAAAPPAIDDLEDWVCDPIDPRELVARSEALRRRISARSMRPHLDDDGLLHFDGRWVVISDAQLPLVGLLVERFGRLVRTDELSDAYIAAGGTTNPTSIRTAITRIRSRVAKVGLTLERARPRGVVLDVASTETD